MAVGAGALRLPDLVERPAAAAGRVPAVQAADLRRVRKAAAVRPRWYRIVAGVVCAGGALVALVALVEALRTDGIAWYEAVVGVPVGGWALGVLVHALDVLRRERRLR